jgi:CHAT domain-containing protein
VLFTTRDGGIALFLGAQAVKLGISAGMFVLSGCVTGVSQRLAGEELIGLSRAAATAGIPSVIASLWKVRDESASAFFDSFFDYFYRCVLQGSTKDKALSRTQRVFADCARTSHPVHWAPFVLFWDWH